MRSIHQNGKSVIKLVGRGFYFLHISYVGLNIPCFIDTKICIWRYVYLMPVGEKVFSFEQKFYYGFYHCVFYQHVFCGIIFPLRYFK